MVFNKEIIKKYLIIILFFFSHQNLEAIENKILFKIDSEIITSIEVFKYSQYLIALDKNIRKLNDEEIFEITKNLMIKERIKKIKLKDEGLELSIDEKMLDNYIKSIFSTKGLNNLNDYKKFLDNLEVDFEAMKEKLIINLLWNNLIFKKFSSKLKINKSILRKQIENQKNNFLESYLLSEIFFEATDKLNIDKKNKEIRMYIDKENFKKAALVFSQSESANDGGNIGWINANALNKNISKALSSLKKGDITNPIAVPGGFLMLRLDDKKFTKKDLNLEEELNKLVKIKTNQQLSQFSNIYFNKIKKEILVNEF
ncbi:peptidylprolyl isomerase [Pelagibacterales bacterium SAG-MED35]|nr:peptidylprolyl isomerase [Pelagibacterales bacterium SAG-MED35]